MTRRLMILLFIGSALDAQSTAPKVIERDPIIGVRGGRESYADSAVTRACPHFVLADPGPQDVGHDGTPFRTWCGVDTTYVLPDADGARWMTAVYSRFAEYDVDPARRGRRGATRDTVRLLTSVLYSRRVMPEGWNPEWLGTVSTLYVRWIGVESAARPDRSMLAGIRYCFNGTAGCWQHFLRRVSGKWSAVDEQFTREFPVIPDGRIGKGSGVDVATLRGQFDVFSNRDANCCPSRELVFTLDLRGDALVLKSHELRKAP